MAKPQLQGILSRPASAIERPKALPAGSYLCVVKGQPQHGKSAKKQTPYVEYTLSILQALDDVDQDELESVLTNKDGSKVALTDKTIRATYYITEGSAYRLVDFLGHCGLDTDSDVSVEQLVEEAPGCQVIATLRHRPSEDGTQVFAELSGTAVAE